jgi:hypothetical protein
MAVMPDAERKQIQFLRAADVRDRQRDGWAWPGAMGS